MITDFIPGLSSLRLFLDQAPPHLLTPAIGLLSLCIGSFLNVVIYRGSTKYLPDEPKNISVTFPKGSFCPKCKTPLKWYHNIPLLSYLALGGKCAYCKVKIPIQYPLVEAITAALITAIWTLSPNIASALIYSWLVICLVCATGIDIKTLMIPNTITGIGVIVLLFLSASSSYGIVQPLIGLLAGGGLTYGCVELGKLLFGKKSVKLEESKAVLWEGDLASPETCSFIIQDDGKSLEESEKMPFSEIFSRPKDYIILKGNLTLKTPAGPELSIKEIKITPDGLTLDKETLKGNHTITGWVKTFTLPQEAMGMGDVKLMALVGAGLGAMPSVHALSLAAGLGAIYGIGLRLKTGASGHIAFGPWISVGAVIIILYRLVSNQ